MSPLFGNKDEKAAEDTAATGAVERLVALPLADLATQVMPAFAPDATPIAGDASTVSRWLMRSYARGAKYRNLRQLHQAVEESLQALARAGLVTARSSSGTNYYAVTRLGEEALAERSVQRHVTSGWMAGRATLAAVEQNAHGELVDCTLSVNVLLADGTPKYAATCNVLCSREAAARLVPGGTMLPVRADPVERSRVIVAWSDPIPVVPTTNPDLIERPQRVLRDGLPCRVVVLEHARNFLQTPSGEEVYGLKVRVTADSSEIGVGVPVPADTVALLQDGKELPAKRLANEPSALAIDWDAARMEAQRS